MGLAPLRQAAATLAQLVIDLRTDQLRPVLDLLRRTFKHATQPRQQQARKTLGKFSIGQPPGLGETDVAAVAGVDAVQFLPPFIHRRPQRLGQREAELTIQGRQTGLQHLLDVGSATVGLVQHGPQPRAQVGKGTCRAQPEKARVTALAHLPHDITQMVAGQAVEHAVQLARQHRTQRCQARSAAFKICRLAVEPLAHQLQARGAFATQAPQLSQLLGSLALAVGQAAQRRLLHRQQAVFHQAGHHLAALRQQLRQQRLLQRRQAAGGQRRVVAGQACCQRPPGRQGKNMPGVNPQRGGGLVALGLHLGGHLGSAEQRVFQRIDLVEHHEARHAAVAQVVTPHRQVGLGDAGVGRQQKHRGMGRRQQCQGQFGLGTDGVEPGRVEHHQAALQQRVRPVDQGMAPGGHLDLVVGIPRRVVLGVLVAPEAQRPGVGHRHPRHAHHLLQRLGQPVDVAHRQGLVHPGFRSITQRGDRLAAAAGGDRQQRQARRLRRVPGEFHRAHRGAARRGRQHTAASVGKKQRVDQFGLATRKFGHEGQHQPVGGQALAQGLAQRLRRCVDQALLAQLGQPSIQPAVERAPPGGQRIQAGEHGGG